MKKFTNDKKGFTLIELVMVIVILGILAAVAVPKLADLSPQAKRSAMLATAESVRAGVAIYFAQNTTFPAGLAASYAAAETQATCDDTHPYFLGVTQGTTSNIWKQTGSSGATLTYTATVSATEIWTFTYTVATGSFTGVRTT